MTRASVMFKYSDFADYPEVMRQQVSKARGPVKLSTNGDNFMECWVSLFSLSPLWYYIDILDCSLDDIDSRLCFTGLRRDVDVVFSPLSMQNRNLNSIATGQEILQVVRRFVTSNFRRTLLPVISCSKDLYPCLYDFLPSYGSYTTIVTGVNPIVGSQVDLLRHLTFIDSLVIQCEPTELLLGIPNRIEKVIFDVGSLPSRLEMANEYNKFVCGTRTIQNVIDAFERST